MLTGHASRLRVGLVAVACAALVTAACGADDLDAPVLTVTARSARSPLVSTSTPDPAPTVTSAPTSAADSPATPTTSGEPEPPPAPTPTRPVTTAPSLPTATPTSTPPSVRLPAGEAGQVVRVIDGDTLVVRMDGVEHTVRLLGIDAPELGDAGGQAALADRASAALAALAGDGAVSLIMGGEPHDDGGRLLRHVARGDRVFSVELARQGWVRAHEYTPNTLLFGAVADAQRAARAAARGIWAPPVAGLAMVVDKVAETVVIANDGGASVDLSGWRLVSLRGPQSVAFPAGTVLRPGATLTVASGSSEGDVAFRQRHVWHNELPDSAELRRPDGRVALYWDDPAASS